MHEHEITREIFRNFPLWMQVVFYIVAFSSIGIFLFGAWKRIQKYRKGRPAGRFNKLPQRFFKVLGIMMTHATLRKNYTYVGLAHWMIFWGFVVLFIGTCIIAFDHDFLRFFGVHLLKGTFYIVFSLFMDVFGVLFIIGLLMMMVRRAKKPFNLNYARVDRPEGKYDRSGYIRDDKIFLWLLLFIAVTGFIIEAARIAADGFPEFEKWAPFGYAMAHLLDSTGQLNAIHMATWWVHGIAVLIFVAYIPYSKAMHILVDYANLMFADKTTAKRLPRVPAEKMDKEGMGYVKLEDFTWKELLDFDACTKCGRCHYVCPARTAGAPLSPRDVILDMRMYADQLSGTEEWVDKQVLVNGGKAKSIAGDVILPETLWSCTTCMACMEVCPVGIEHLTTIVNLRRALVDEGEMEDMLQDALANIGDYGNSFGKPERMRAKWTKDLDFKPKDARKEPVEYLWFVGDYASFDERIQERTRKVATILHRAGVDFGLLYEDERNAGNDVRRVGEEGLYEMLAEDNIAALKSAKFQKIFTTDPHSYNTIKNEYPDFGGEFEIYHYTELLLELIRQGKIRISDKLKGIRVTYHDPCYLGRYNGITEPPREIIRALGMELVEMPRNRSNSFCCGAGGGRIWMDDSGLKERPSENRIKEALSLGDIRYFIIACPKDFAMYSDAVKTSGNEGKIEVKDIIELIEEAMEGAEVTAEA